MEKEIGVFVETEDVPVVRTIKKEPDLLTKIASSLPDALNIEIASDTKTPIEIKKADSPIVKEEDNVPLTRRPQPEKINVAKSSSNNEEGNVVTSLFGIKFVDDTKKPVEVKKPLSATEIRKEETPVKAKEKITFDRGVAEKGDDSLVTSIFGITFVNDTPKVAEVKEVLKTEERKSNKELVTPHKAEITFAPVSEALSKSDETSPLQDQAAKSSPVSIPLSAPIFLEPETHSLMKSESSLPEKKKTKEADIPLELPLLPFESSPHVWSFSHYKNTFHGDDKNSEPKKEPAPPEKKEALFYPVESKPVAAPTLSSTNNVEDEEVSLEKTPLTRGDESLVFLASVMLLVIILILGYMYGKGRL